MYDWRVLTRACACGFESPDEAEFCSNCGALLSLPAPRVIIKEALPFEVTPRPVWTRREKALYLGLRVPVALALILGSAYMMTSQSPSLEQHFIMPIIFCAGVVLLVISLVKASVD